MESTLPGVSTPPPTADPTTAPPLGDAGEGIIKLGPAGEPCWGKSFDDKGRTEIAQIFIWHDERKIWGIQFQYVENEKLVLGERHGGTSSWAFDSIQLKYPSEYVAYISGRYSIQNHCITKMEIHTNVRRNISYGCQKYPYPRKDDPEFHFNVGSGGCQFHGFHGTAADDELDGCLTSIGVYLKPAATLGELMGNQRKANYSPSDDSGDN